MQSARTRRIVIVLLLAALSVALWAPDLRRALGHPLGVFGFAISVNNRVTNLQPDSPAARSGVKPGSLVDYTRMSARDRLFAVWGGETLNPGDPVQLALFDGGHRYQTGFPSIREPLANEPVVIVRAVIALVFLGAGMLVVLRSPSMATWAFFIFSLVQAGPVNVAGMIGPVWLRFVATEIFWVSLMVTSLAAPIFALYLLHTGPIAGWRRVVARITVTLGLAACALETWYLAALVFYGICQPVLDVIPFVIAVLAVDATPFILFATYFESQPQARERLRWVIAGFAVSACARTIDAFGGNGQIAFFELSYLTHSILIALASFSVALTVIYAILKHRIIDINVAVSRALVYTVLSAIVVGIFALVDLFFNRVLSESKAGFIADIALALVLGFFFNGLHGHVDRLVDGLLFRNRHLAEKHLLTVISAIPYVKSAEHVDRLLTEEPIRAFDLTGSHLGTIDHVTTANTASLVAYLEAVRRGLRLNEHGFRGSEFTDFEAAVAAPIFCHGELSAVVFYGFHNNGTDLDGEEVAILERLAEAAGAAYDHLEAQALRLEVESLRSQLAAFTPAQPSH
jgi:hypothetical protein